MQVAGRTTYITWNRDGRTVQANNASGTFLSVTRLQLLTGVSARGGTAGASILSLGSRLYAVTET